MFQLGPLEEKSTRIRLFREHLKKTMPEMAKLLGVEYRTYLNWDYGTRRPSQEILDKLAILGLNLHWLSTGEGPMVLPVRAVAPGAIGHQVIFPTGIPTGESLGIPNVTLETPIDPEGGIATRIMQTNVEDAYELLWQVCHAFNLEQSKLNPKEVALVLGTAAERLSFGVSREEVRRKLVHEVEVRFRSRQRG